MAVITHAPGKAMYVEVNGIVLKGARFSRQRTAGELRFPTSGMVADADGNYEMPHGAGIVSTRASLSGPYDQAAPFHAAPYNLRAGVTVSIVVGQTAALTTPSINYVVLSTTDENEAEQLGTWSAELAPTTDTSAGYYS